MDQTVKIRIEDGQSYFGGIRYADNRNKNVNETG